jgi:glycosyltransferase involved in cell wall biosynthesis
MNKTTLRFSGKLGIQQRVLPAYRVDFFDLLAEACEGGLSIFAGDVPREESIPNAGELNIAEYVKSHNYHVLDVQSRYYFLWQGGLINWLENWDPDVLIVEANPRYLSTNGGIQWMHARGRAVIGWGLGAPPVGKPRSLGGQINTFWRSYLRARLYDQVDALIAYSHKGAKEYNDLLSIQKPIYVASNAVARRPAAISVERPPKFENRPVVLYVGRIQKRKNIDHLIRACASLPENLQPKLWIVGDGPIRSELEKLASMIYPEVEFFGMQKGEELASIFRKADIFVLPGTGGLAVQEAMSYALPVIVAEGDGTQEDFVKPDNGWLIPSDNEEALLETIKIALSDPERLRKMGKNSFRIVQDEVNVEQMVSTFIEAINNSAGRNSS